MEQTVTMLDEMCGNMAFVAPCICNWEPARLTPAGELKMKMITTWSTEELEVTSHFVGIPTKNMPNDFPDALMMTQYKTAICKLKGSTFERDLPVEVSNCMNMIERFKRRVHVDDKANEVTNRLVYANAITLMICAINGYFFRVEDRVLQDNDASDDDLVCGVSNRSKADYICYSLHGFLKPVAVIIETKAKFSWSGIAQLLGYYYRAATDHRKPGVAVLLSNEKIHIVCFPFCTQEGSLSNAICFGGINFVERLEVCLYMLAVITSASYSSDPPLVILDTKFLPVPKSFKFQIETEQDRCIDNLEKMVKDLQKELAKKSRDLDELKCRYMPMEVSIPHYPVK